MQTGAVIGDARRRALRDSIDHVSPCVDIVYVIADLLLGGAQKGLLTLVDLGVVRPERTHLVVLGRGDPSMIEGVCRRGPWGGLDLCDKGPAPWRWAVGGWKLARLLARTRPKMVVLSLEPPNLVGRCLRPFFPRMTFCSFEHSSLYRRRLYRMLFPLLSPAVDVVLYDSPATRHGIEPSYSSRARHWIEVPLYVLDPTLPTKADYRIGASVQILSVGRLVPAKNQSLLLRIIAELRRRGWPVTCEIVGEGPLRRELERLRAALGVEGYVHLPGQDTRWQEKAFRFDLYLQTSEHEGACLTVLEAMAAGLPIMATAVGEIPRHLAGGAGIALGSRDPAAIADVIEALLHDETKRAALGRAARAKVQALYDAQEVRTRLQKTVGKLLGDEMPATFGGHRE